MLSRTNLADATRHSSLNSRPVNRLQPLCFLFPTPVLCFQSLAASFCETPGWGVPSRPSGRSDLQTLRRSLSSLESALTKNALATPLDSALTKTPGGGGTVDRVVRGKSRSAGLKARRCIAERKQDGEVNSPLQRRKAAGPLLLRRFRLHRVVRRLLSGHRLRRNGGPCGDRRQGLGARREPTLACLRRQAKNARKGHAALRCAGLKPNLGRGRYVGALRGSG